MKQILPVVVCSFLAIVIGAVAGMWSAMRQKDAAPSSGVVEEAKKAPAQGPTLVKELKPIVANLSAPPGAWIRLELALAFSGKLSPRVELQINEFATDTTDFLRATSAQQLEGPNGLRRLREDLLERARLRAGNEVDAVLIQTLVIQ